MRSRDLIDLAFLAERHGQLVLQHARDIAEDAYGTAILRYLRAVLEKFTENRRYAAACTKSLGVDNPKILRTGLSII